MACSSATYKKGFFIPILLIFFLLASLQAGLMPAHAADSSGATACAITPDLLDGQGLRVTGLGLRVTGLGLRVTGLGLSVTGLGLRVTGLGTTPEQIVQDIVNNPVTPQWLTSLLPDVAGGAGYNGTPTVILVADDFSRPDSHGFEVRKVFDDLLRALDAADGPNTPNIRLENINIADVGYQTVGIATTIRNRVNDLSSLGYKHFVINMSFGIIDCDSTQDVTLVDSQSGQTFRVTADFSFSAFQAARNTALAPGAANKAVTPIIECIVKKQGGGNTYIGYLGYQNDNPVTVRIPIGNDNKFQQIDNRGQPEIFGPGRHSFVAQVEFVGVPQAWIIKGPDGKTRSATASSSPTMDCAKKGIVPPPLNRIGDIVPLGYGLTQYIVQVLGIPENFVDEYLMHLMSSAEEDPIAGLRALLRSLLQRSYAEANDSDPNTIFAAIPVASSGNYRHLFGGTALAPAIYPESIASSATLGDFGSLWVLSQDGNVTAPGAGYPFAFDAAGNITEMGAGTSFSAPFISTLSALWLTYPNACAFGDGLPPLVPASTPKNANAISRVGTPSVLNCAKPLVLHPNQASVTVAEGQTAANAGTISGPNNGTAVLTASVGTVINNGNGTWSWSFVTSDGPAQSQTVIITANNKSYTSFGLTVNNVAPTADFTAVPGLVNEGGTSTLTFSNPIDPSSVDTASGFRYSYDCNGDGNFEAADVAAASFACAYPVHGSYTLSGRIKDKDGGYTDYSAVVTVNALPVLTAAQPSLVVDEGQTAFNTGTVSDADSSYVLLTASVGTVINNGDGTWSWNFTTTDGPAQSQSVIISADDGSGGTAQISFALTVNNVAPAVNAGPDQTVNENDLVSFNGTFFDPGANDAPFTITWDFGDGTTTSGTTTPTHTYAVQGTYTVTLTVTDKDGGVGSDSLVVTVLRVNNPPVCSTTTPSIGSLWPPDHRMVDVNINGVTDPDGNAISVTITSIFQDEPTNGLGDGDTSPDGAGIGTNTAQVRAERAGGGDGRVYLISFTAADGQGGSCAGAVTVSVQRDQSGSAAVNSGTIYDSTLP